MHEDVSEPAAAARWHGVWLLTALGFAFGPWVYFYVSSRGGIGPGATFELLCECWPVEVAGAFVASRCVKRLKLARGEAGLPNAVAYGYLVAARAAFWLSLLIALLIPFSLVLLFGISLGAAG